MLNILLPIETINREIDFRIMMASLLSGKGYKIYIGQHDFLMSLLPNMENGIYIGKNLFSKRAEQEGGEKYFQLKDKSVDVVYLHEEGAVYAGTEENWKQVLKFQYKLDFFDGNDKVCVWGEFQRQNDLDRSSGIDVLVTGHPRFDLYKKKWNSYFVNDIKEIKEKYKDFVLINGNYAYANHGLGEKFIFSDVSGYMPDNVKKRLERVEIYTYSKKQLASVIDLTHRLAVRYPNKNFIYRPHPSENHDFYKAVFGGVDNIYVNHEGAVGPWILGADAVIHDGCTTAIEATLAGIPVINYKPLHNEEFDIWLPNQLGKRAENLDDVFNLLDNIEAFDFDFSNSPSYKRVCDLFYNFEGDSFEKIIDIIESRANEKVKSYSENPSDGFIKMKYLTMKAKQETAKLISPQVAKESQYHQRKFYGFTKPVISEKFSQAELVLGKKIDYKVHNPYLIEVK